MSSCSNPIPIYKRPAELLQRLIQFDTTNPPGNEAACVAYLNDLLTEAGIQATILGKTPQRTNLVARMQGQGSAPPLLMYGHVDVVSIENQSWQHPPFEGKIVDGFVWGRGALDMKSGVAMMVAALLRAFAEGLPLPGDVILAVVSDEEALGNYGARYLIEEHADLFKGVRFAIGEFGGFTLHIGGKRFYPIMVAEKQACWMKATLRGPGGHGSMPVRGGALAKLAHFLQRLDRRNLPVHITPSARLMLDTLGSKAGGVSGLMLKKLANPLLANTILSLLGERGRVFAPMLHNTVSPTILHGSDKINVIPSQVTVELDGRLLPGFKPEDLIAELHEVVGKEAEIEVTSFDPGPPEPNMGLFGTLADVLRDADPEGVPVPLLLSGVTDARLFAKLGIQTYGFTPMQLPPDFSFWQFIHAANERIPVAAMDFGSNAIYQLLGKFSA